MSNEQELILQLNLKNWCPMILSDSESRPSAIYTLQFPPAEVNAMQKTKIR